MTPPETIATSNPRCLYRRDKLTDKAMYVLRIRSMVIGRSEYTDCRREPFDISVKVVLTIVFPKLSSVIGKLRGAREGTVERFVGRC